MGEPYCKIPKKIIFEPPYKKAVSAEAKILYMILLDLKSLSKRNGHIDENGEPYVFYKNMQVQELFGCGHQKACDCFKELEEVGLIRRVQQRRMAAKIYVLEI